MKNVNQLTKGAMFLAIYSVLLLMTLYIPVLGAIVNFFLPLPFILFSAKNNLKSSIVFLIAATLISLILGSMLAIPITLAYGMTGVVMGYLIFREKGRWMVLLAGSFVFLLNTIVQYIISVVFFEMNFLKEFIITFKQSFKSSLDIMEKMGQSPEQKVIEQMQKGIDMIETLMPSMIVLASFMIVFLIMLVSVPILRRFGVSLSDWKPFRELTLPKSLLWYYLLSMAGSLIINPEQGTYFYLALANLLFILQVCMLIQGASFIFYYCYQKGYAKAVPVFALAFSLILPFLLYIVRILGIIDLGFDLRKRLVKKQ